MEVEILELKILPEQASDLKRVEAALALKLKKPNLKGLTYKILRKSLDARRKPIHFIFRIQVLAIKNEPESRDIQASTMSNSEKVAYIIGFGPAGIFAAIELLKMGIKPIVLERGRRVRERRRDLMQIYKHRSVVADSNYCFGEGGAGTFSDGKLYTRSKKRGDIDVVLRTFVEHGAKSEIMYEAHPHIGTNKLPGIVESLRESIEKAGGEVLFDTKLLDLKTENGEIHTLITNRGEMRCENVILATGHSARDIFELLNQRQVLIEPKPFALGVRIEHSQVLIDRAQYKCDVRGEFLPPSSYSLVQQVEGRGVFSFCMCPGGIIAPSMTDSNEVVVNGWSPSKRNGQFANSGLVVQITPDDWRKFEGHGVLGALKFQESIEHLAFEAGGSDLSAPAQRATDFVNRRNSTSLPECSYIPGVVPQDLHAILPHSVASRLQLALKFFDKKIKGYASSDALLVGVESRTSSPVRIPRDKESLEHVEVKGIYPCGEGAGYAGGIMSAALDGISCARALALKLTNQVK